MLSKRIPTILPDLTFNEALEITKIHSIVESLPANMPIIANRPFRAPHHTISTTSLVGGGINPKPGEISLAHNGVLFLDELPEFNRKTLEVMRGPLEDKKITISRLNASLTYPCNFMLVASMNPCPCGFCGSEEKQCTCTPEAISKYISKISGPLLKDNQMPETSREIKQRVNQARKIQQERYKKCGIYSNAELTQKLVNEYCKIDNETSNLLEKAFNKLGFSARTYSRILKVARTIADLDNKENIEIKHVAEAIQYRNLDKKYWKN